MSDPIVKTGEQFWNDEHTEGYEITEDIDRHTVLMARSFKALGNAPEAKPNHPLPKWMADIVLTPGGVDGYRKRNNITNT